MTERVQVPKSAEAYRTISEVAAELKLPQHVLRFWETRFPQVKPLKRAGGRRFYRPEDVALLRAIKVLLYGEGYTIKGVQRMLQEHGPRGVASGLVAPPARVAAMEPEGRGAATPDDEPPLSVRAPPPLPPGSSAGQGGSRPVDHERPRPGPADLIARLEAVAFDLSECERLLGRFRGP